MLRVQQAQISSALRAKSSSLFNTTCLFSLNSTSHLRTKILFSQTNRCLNFSTKSPVRSSSEALENSAATSPNLSAPRLYKNVAFYQFVKILPEELDPFRRRLLDALAKFEVLGRIYIANEGINAQFACPSDRLDEVKGFFNSQGPGTTDRYPLPLKSGIHFNISACDDTAFTKLNVKIRKEIVRSDISEAEYDIQDQPTSLSPEEWHDQINHIKEKGAKLHLFDVRNQYESAIGHFEGAVLPDVDTFRENMDQLIEDTRGLEKEEIFMYCTGGIRCSKAGAILKAKGFDNVKMLQGGVTAYGNYIKKNEDKRSLYRGHNFTFDKRKGEPITDELISKCHQCSAPTAHYTNCRNIICNLLFLQCPACAFRFKKTCGSPTCLENPVLARSENLERSKSIYKHSDRVRPKLVII